MSNTVAVAAAASSNSHRRSIRSHGHNHPRTLGDFCNQFLNACATAVAQADEGYFESAFVMCSAAVPAYTVTLCMGCPQGNFSTFDACFDHDESFPVQVAGYSQQMWLGNTPNDVAMASTAALFQDRMRPHAYKWVTACGEACYYDYIDNNGTAYYTLYWTRKYTLLSCGCSAESFAAPAAFEIPKFISIPAIDGFPRNATGAQNLRAGRPPSFVRPPTNQVSTGFLKPLSVSSNYRPPAAKIVLPRLPTGGTAAPKGNTGESHVLTPKPSPSPRPSNGPDLADVVGELADKGANFFAAMATTTVAPGDTGAGPTAVGSASPTGISNARPSGAGRGASVKGVVVAAAVVVMGLVTVVL
ncbi:hypothetical protein HDU96_007393 [Phlyctochytrium bullatum]|nr:hypothetical protein HDU96_007393 [Phlyctochytrium bullatum]